MASKKQFSKAYVVTVDMGYGHQRAVYPFMDIAAVPKGWDSTENNIISANNYPGIPANDQRLWEGGRGFYEQVSRMKNIPLIGETLFDVLIDRAQRIQPFYPRRDLSKPTMQLKQIYWGINRGWGRHLIETLNKKPLPLITSFFTTAYFAEEHGYKGDIYCICTDTDVSRAWAPMYPEKTRINYLAPNKRVKERLMLYGIKESQIFVTGFPLPKENIGERKNLEILKKNLGNRIVNLDPQGKYRTKYQHTLDYYLGKDYCVTCEIPRPLTITFAVGGAGAQREIGVTILESLHEAIDAGKVRLNLVAGSRNDVYRFYEKNVHELHIGKNHNGNIHIVYHEDKSTYFKMFNEILHETDILWTKPSELSFYCGLGLPIIMAPTIGAQEDFNRQWLHSIGSAFEQEDPRYTHEWLFDWLNSGWLAEAAMQGFMDAPRNGAFHVEDMVLHQKKSEIEDIHLL